MDARVALSAVLSWSEMRRKTDANVAPDVSLYICYVRGMNVTIEITLD